MPRNRHRRSTLSKTFPSNVSSLPGMDESSAETYPSPAQRARIIARRQQLMKELLRLAIYGKAQDSDELEKLMQRYGPTEVFFINEILRKQFERSSHLIDSAEGYRHYRLGFARFGGARPFLSDADLEELNGERALLHAKREFKRESTAVSRAREAELDNLLQMDWQFWEDITTQDIPPRPADIPAPAQYPAPLAEILTWGWTLDSERIAREASNWAAYERGLEKIVFDETLRNGWPSEPASWAPWHALRLLGEICAFGSARRLADLYALPNDWLSDLLPDIWAKMGAPAAISVWDILDDPTMQPEARGLAAFGLERLVQNDAIPRMSIISQLVKRLSANPANNPSVNAYIIVALEKLEAVEAKATIRSAFENNLVDTKIISLDGLEFMEENS